MTATSQQVPAPRPAKRFGWVKVVLAILLVVIGLPAGCTYWLFSALSTNEPARIATAQAQAHPAVIAKFGSPLTRGRFGSGSIRIENASGSAELSFTVTGPKGSGKLNLKATRSGGQWTIDALQLVPDDGTSPINVVGGGIRS